MVVSGEPGSSIHIPVNPQGSARLPDDRDTFRSRGSLLMQAAGASRAPRGALAAAAVNAAAAASEIARRQGRYARSARYVPAVQSARTCRARSSLV